MLPARDSLQVERHTHIESKRFKKIFHENEKNNSCCSNPYTRQNRL